MSCQLHYAVAGPETGSPLLLGGSLGTTLGMWDPQVARLAHRHRIVAFDHRGHGSSPAPGGPYDIASLGHDVLRLLDRLGVDRLSYCGLSLGGMVGMWLAQHAPQRIERLILLCTAAHLPPRDTWRDRAQLVRTTGGTAVVADAVIARWLTPAFALEHPQIVRRLRQMLLGTSAEGYASCCEAIADMDLRAGLPGICCPTLVVAAAGDPATPPPYAEEIADAVPGARLEVLTHGAHLASVERAAEVTDLIADHLEAQEAR